MRSINLASDVFILLILACVGLSFAIGHSSGLHDAHQQIQQFGCEVRGSEPIPDEETDITVALASLLAHRNSATRSDR